MLDNMSNLVANRRIRVIPSVITYVTRTLQGHGRITVSVGQQVTPEDIIGKSTISAGFRNINLAKVLNCSGPECKKYLQRPLGQTIYKGELLALKPGSLFSQKKMLLAPTDGRIDSYDDKTGQLRLSFLPHDKDLAAAVFGIVSKVDNLKGEAVIKTQVTEIYGLFGTGKSREGALKVLGQRGDLLGKSILRDDLAGQIVAGGALIYSDAIAAAVSKGIFGLITGGVNAADYRSMAGGRLTFPQKFGTDIGIGLLVCEGFGSVPLGEDIFNILLEYNGRFAILEGNKGRLLLPTCEADCMATITKTELPRIEADLVNALSEVQAVDLKLGQVVRVISSPFLGEQGQIISIDAKPTTIPTGIIVNLVTIQSKTRKLKVPYTNLEIIS
jgi:hypothetical protein